MNFKDIPGKEAEKQFLLANAKEGQACSCSIIPWSNRKWSTTTWPWLMQVIYFVPNRTDSDSVVANVLHASNRTNSFILMFIFHFL